MGVRVRGSRRALLFLAGPFRQEAAGRLLGEEMDVSASFTISGLGPKLLSAEPCLNKTPWKTGAEPAGQLQMQQVYLTASVR